MSLVLACLSVLCRYQSHRGLMICQIQSYWICCHCLRTLLAPTTRIQWSAVVPRNTRCSAVQAGRLWYLVFLWTDSFTNGLRSAVSEFHMNQGSNWDSMDQHGVPAPDWPSGKHSVTFFFEKRHSIIFCRLFSEILVTGHWGLHLSKA